MTGDETDRIPGQHADSFHRDLHKDRKADYLIANPPFNMRDWGGDRMRDDARWKHGAPLVANANILPAQSIRDPTAPIGHTA